MNSSIVLIYFIASVLLFIFGLLTSFAIIAIPDEIRKLRKELKEIKEEFQRL